MSRLAQLTGRYLIQRSTPSSVATLDCVIPHTTSTPVGPGYRAIECIGWLLPATDGTALFVRFSNDGGATYKAGATDYAWAQSYQSLNGADTSGVNRDDSDSEIQISAGGNATGEGMNFDFRVHAPLHASRRTSLGGHMIDLNTSAQIFRSIIFGSVLVTEVNNAIRFLFSSGNIAAGEVSYYGIY